MSARTVADISDADLLRRAVGICAAKARRQKRVAWSVVSATFGLGSTFSTQLCRRFGFDPETGKDLVKVV